VIRTAFWVSNTRTATWHPLVWVLALLATDMPDVQAGSILGFAAIGARSHQYCMLRIGQELAARGHTFTLLVSDLENLSVHELGSKAFPGLNIVAFSGPPGVGTKEWYEQLSRDLTTVCNWSDHFRQLLWATDHASSDADPKI